MDSWWILVWVQRIRWLGFLWKGLWNPNTCDCKCNKTCKIDEYLDTKNWSCEKHLIGKLVLGCEDEILNNKKKCEKSNCLIHNTLLIIVRLSIAL